MIAAVEFDLERMSEDIWLQKGRTDVASDRYTATLALREWLTAEAVLRVLFFGSARKIGVGVTYVPFDPDEDAVDYRRECGCCGRTIPHIDPHDCSAGVHEHAARHVLSGVRLVRDRQAVVARRHPAERRQRLLARPVVAGFPDRSRC